MHGCLGEYIKAQIKAFNDWIWCFGVDTRMNLRDYFTEDELMHIWVSRYAKQFREEYLAEHPECKNKW